MNALDLIRLALRDAQVNGVGQTPSDEENNDTFLHLNSMLAQWSRKRWLVHHLLDVSAVSTGATSYSLVAGGDFNTPRTDRIESAFVRWLGSTPAIDTPLVIIESREDWNRITVKSLSAGGPPTAVFYDSGFPSGTLYFWPVAGAGAYEMHVSIKAELTQITSLTDQIVVPGEYLDAVIYNLAKRARMMFGQGPDQDLNELAKGSLNTLRQANTQVPLLQMPAALAGARGRFSVYTGGTR